MDDTDRQLITQLQKGIPFETEPFRSMGKRTGIDAAEVLLRIHRLKSIKLVREISAIFDSRSLGYKGALVAMQFPAERLEEAVQVINQHPGVSHSARRNHSFNFWFKLAVPPPDRVEEHVQILAEASGAQKSLVLPTQKIYKASDKINDPVYHELPGAELTHLEMHSIRILQEDLPLTDKPFQFLARKLGMPEARLFEMMRLFTKRGILRRFGATFYQKKTSVMATSMIVWQLPEERHDEVGMALATFPEVIHCSKRPDYPEFPYSLYTMVHTSRSAECAALVERIKQKIGPWPNSVLLSTKEYKKVRIKYFALEIEEWRTKAKVLMNPKNEVNA